MSQSINNEAAEKTEQPAGAAEEQARLRQLSGFWKGVAIALGSLAIFLSLNQLLNWGFFIGHQLLDTAYLYSLGALLIGLVFIYVPATGKSSRIRVPWYDVVAFLITIAVFCYFTLNAYRIISEAWEFMAPPTAVMVSIAGWLMLLEATRRAGGTAVFVVVALFSLYPVFAEVMPGPISGLGQDFETTMAYHFTSSESVLGIPMRAFGELVIGFVMFGAVLQFTGAAEFFNNLAFAAFGKVRGGPAKVSIAASGLMGSVSGSVVSNVLTTGVVTIPAMKRTGFSAKYAAGVEACASTGGVLMPPIMGATAFVMAAFLGIPYGQIAIAAAIPSILFYFALFMQIDGYAARHNLKGLPEAELPSLRKTFMEGWQYIIVFVVLIWLLLVEQIEALAPFYSTALLLIINQFSPKYRLSWKKLGNLILGVTASLSELAALLAGVGLIIGAMSVTGLAGTLANDLIYLAGDNVYVLLVMGAITSFIFGMGMTITACYIFLAIVLAPPLIASGFDPLAVHLFMMYWGMVSFITPPVSLASFVAAGLAGARPVEVGMQSMRLGSTMYFVPFFFVLNPALILRGDGMDVFVVILTAIIGLALIASALEGYLLKVGRMDQGIMGRLARLCLFFGGLMFALPAGGDIDFTNFELLSTGIVLTLISIFFAKISQRTSSVPARMA
ncbi:TRAP transporter permease [Orrella sp. 11846]|uniref:TRAP transporter permease n=1 Tax=Orrella sp. 11846 TaxID=3409913 RepID=UPI003B5A4863